MSAAGVAVAVPEGPLPDCAELLAAMLEDGLPVRSVRVPADLARARCRRSDYDPSAWDVVAFWIWERQQTMARAEKKAGSSAVRTRAWLAANRSWLGCAYDALNARRAADAARAEAVEAERLAHVERKRERQAMADAERRQAAEAKERMRRLVSEDARKRSRLQGYAVLGFDAFQDPRPRWLYVLLGQDGSLYCGSALSLRRRVAAHRRGMGAAVTRDTRQRWHLLHAELLPAGQAALCAEFALLHSEPLQDALLAARSPRAAALHDRFGCAVPWLGLVAR